MIAILLILQAVGFEFLSVDPVARRNQGGIGVLGDGYEIIYNPAALAWSESRISTISYFNYIGGTHFGQLGHQMKSIGIAAKYFNGGTLKRTDNMGNELSTFGVNFIDLAAGKAFATSEKFGLGAAVKFQYERIDTFTSLGGGIDIGSLYKINDKINVGAVVKNLGVGIKPFIEEREMLPLEFGIGGVINWSKSNLFADIYIPIEGKPNVRIGYEDWLLENLALKGGFNSKLFEVKTATGPLDLITGFNLGIGLKIQSFCFDYLFTPYGELGFTHRISLSFAHSQ